MLHFATKKLKKDKHHFEDNEINIHQNEFTHLFTMNGEEITNLQDIEHDMKILVCSMNKHFKGIINSQKLVSFRDYKLVKNENIKNHLFHKTHQWIRERMHNWNHSNVKLDDKNKLLDINTFNTADYVYGLDQIIPPNMNSTFLQTNKHSNNINSREVLNPS